MDSSPQPSLLSRSVGALVGTFVGDALGAPFEGMSPGMVRCCWSRKRLMVGDGRYTDDTQMMIGVAESFVACGGFDAADMASRFVENYQRHRGYGGTIHRVLAALRGGRPWDQAATTVFPEGSFGNGAAMRIAPVGVLYRHDLRELRRVAELSASITHGHPLGKEGAVIAARAIAGAMEAKAGELDPAELLMDLRRFARAEHGEFHSRLCAIAAMLNSDPSIRYVTTELGNDVRSHTAVPAAIYAFLSNPESFRAAVSYAVLLGGDTDTIAAMTGAISGAYLGLDGIPQDWLDKLENDRKGLDYVRQLGRDLCELHERLIAAGRCVS